MISAGPTATSAVTSGSDLVCRASGVSKLGHVVVIEGLILNLIIIISFSSTTMINRAIKTAVLGVGLAGLSSSIRVNILALYKLTLNIIIAFHVPFILALPELFVLSAVLERNPQSEGGKVQERFGVTPPKIYRTLDEVLADPEIELVVVGTPNETHYEFAKLILSAGKHSKGITFYVINASF